MLKISGYDHLVEVFRSNQSLVYRATQSDNTVIIKTIANPLPGPQQVAGILHEFQLTRRFDSPYVIKALDLVTVGKSQAIILEDFGTSDLNTYLNECGRVSLSEFFKIATALTQAISEIHQAGVIHKDINPSNILYDANTNQIKVIDFGISSELSSEQQRMHVGNHLGGTLTHISPEQTGRVNQDLDYRSDFYSLGITLYQLLTGRLPFEADDSMGWVYCHIAKTPEAPHVLSPKIPQAISALVLKLIAKNARDRYQSASGILRDLEICQKMFETGKTQPFTVGKYDISERFSIPQTLYGRETEVESLLNAFESVVDGPSQAIMVGGFSGVGKTALVNEVHKSIVKQRGFFIQGKFDQFQRDVPYLALSQAFSDLMNQILRMSKDKLDKWRSRFQKALEPNAQAVINIVPVLEYILGPQPALPELKGNEEQIRLYNTLRRFVQVLTEEQPLVLFLDDLQWSDPPTLALIQEFMSPGRINQMLLIGAYRDNEVNEHHALMLALAEMEKQHPVASLSLLPLKIASVNQILMETLYSDDKAIKPLTELIFEITRGNPFFINQLLKNLYRESCFTFQIEKKCWTWDMAYIRKKEITDNVVAFMIEQLKELPAPCQLVLQLAACIGSQFDLKTMAVITEQAPREVAASLWEAIREGIVAPLNSDYRLMKALSSQPAGELEGLDFDVAYKFRHDRVQQAAYALIKDDRKKAAHLSIGRLMLSHTPPEELDDDIILIVSHFNMGTELLENQKQRTQLAELNYQAGRRAKASNANKLALQLLETGRQLLPDDAWSTRYRETFDHVQELSQCAFLSSEFDRAEEANQELLEAAQSKLDKAGILTMQLVQHGITGKRTEAIEAGILALTTLDPIFAMAALPTGEDIEKEMALLKKNLGNKNIAELVNKPVVTDPAVKLCMRAVTELAIPAYATGNTTLFTMTILRMVNLSLVYGSTADTPYAYGLYGLFLTMDFDDMKAGYEFGKISVEINQHLDDMEYRARVLFVYVVCICAWNETLSSQRKLAEEGLQASLQTGDIYYTGYFCQLRALWETQTNLELACEVGEVGIKILEDVNYQDLLNSSKIYQRYRLNMRGLTKDLYSLSTDDFDEEVCLKEMESVNFLTGIAFYHMYKMIVYYTHGDYASALKHNRIAEPFSAALWGNPSFVEFTVFNLLILTATYPDMAAQEQTSIWETIGSEYTKLKKWADHFPPNFEHHALAVEAEIALIEGRHDEVSQLFDLAVKAAEKNEYRRFEALYKERQARYLLDQDKVDEGYQALLEAHYAYGRWRATGKQQQMLSHYPRLRMTLDKFNQSQHGTSITRTSGTHGTLQLDLGSVIKAAQTLSEEVVLDSLLKKLMDIVRENAGAQKAVLILVDASMQLSIEAYSEGEETLLLSKPLEQEDRVARNIVQYVARRRKHVLLGNASENVEYAQDRYVQKMAPKSILCLPILKQKLLMGVLYLENNLAEYAFTPNHKEVLAVLVGQAAISIENASLYANLEQKVKERTLELEAKNQQIISSIQYAECIQRAILPDIESIRENLPASLIFFRPKDIVSGDFYFFARSQEALYIAVVDCTGHGVPGGFMSILGNSLLNQVIKIEMTKEPGEILTRLNMAVVKTLKQQSDVVLASDGMDIGLCKIQLDLRKLSYAGAKLPLYLLSGNGTDQSKKLTALKANRRTIGGKRNSQAMAFSQHDVALNEGDVLYMSTDGYPDQCNNKRKSFGTRRFRQLITEIAHLSMEEQYRLLDENLLKWREDQEQRDDIAIVGIQIT